MGKIKEVIEVSNNLADNIVSLIDKSLDDDEKNDLQATLFEDFYKRFSTYDTKTISELYKNLKISHEII
jgi:hypothetical protein